MGAAVPISGVGEAESWVFTQCGLGRGLPPYQMASWSTQPFGHNRHGSRLYGRMGQACSRKLRKWGDIVSLSVGELGPHL